jgi:photosystem II stability/assembly factor-like uncharacterized protein
MQNLILVGTAVTRPESIGSMYQMRPGGAWEMANGIPADAAVQAITPHPTRERLVFAATRKGVYRSTDGGASWHRLDVTAQAVQFWTVVVHPQQPDTLFAGTAPVGVFRSDDGGDTWRQCGAQLPERFKIGFGASRLMRIGFHATNPQIMFGAIEINGLLVSTDGGEHWAAATSGLEDLARLPHLKSREVTDDDTEGMFDAHSVCSSPARPDSLFYICRLGIFETQDLGKTFRELDVRKYAPFSISSRSEAGAFYRSADLGDTWQRADAQVQARSTIMGFNLHVSDPRGAVTVTRGGQVFSTTDACHSWTEHQLPANAGDAFCAAIL